jgi:hypothetical protein
MQATRYFVGVAVEFTACMKNGHDDFCSRATFFFVYVHRDAAAIIDDTDRLIYVDDDLDFSTVTSQGFIDGVIYSLKHHVM